MNIAFFSVDSSLQKWVETLGAGVNLVRETKHLAGVVQDLLEQDEYREMILFLDFDWEKKKVEAFNKKISKKEDGVIRIAISSEMSIKELKKHQQGKTSCHGYIRKPLTYVLLRKILEDLGVYDQYKDNFDFELPEKEEVKEKATAKPINKEEVIEDLSNELFGMDEETAMRDEATLESIPAIEDPEATTTQSEINEVDEIPEDDLDLDLEDEGEMDFNLDDENDNEEINLDDESEDIPINDGDDDFDDDFDLDLTDSSSNFNPSELKVNTVVKNLVDLHRVSGAEAPYKCDLNDRIQAKFDHVFPREREQEVSTTEEPVHNHFMSEDELHIAPITVHLDDDLENELDELTQNRELPSPEELSEFEENTGDFNLDEANESPEDIAIDFSDEDENEDTLDLSSEDHEEISMKDENDSLDLDDELDISEDSPEGELSFSDNDDLDLEMESESEASGHSDDLDSGLDFDLSDDSEDGELEVGIEAKDESENFDQGEDSLDFDATEDDELDLDQLSADHDENIDDADENLDFSLDEDDSESSEDLDFSAESVSEGTGELEFGADDDDEGPITEESSFDAGELSFGDEDDDEEIEATTVFDPRKAAGESMQTSSFDPDAAPDASTGIEEEIEDDLAEDLFATEADEDGDVTNPTMLMSKDMTDEVQGMLDEQMSSTQEFRPQTPSAPNLSDDEDDDLGFSIEEDEDEDQEFNLDDDSEDSFPVSDQNEAQNLDKEGSDDSQDSLDSEVGFSVEEEDNSPDYQEEEGDVTESMVNVNFGHEEDVTATLLSDDLMGSGSETSERSHAPVDQDLAYPDEDSHSSTSRSESTGHLSITSQEDRIPPSFHEGEAVRLQATIRQLREERESLLDEINLLNQDKKLLEQDNLGLRAELDEAKIEVSILKKRNTSEVDEMKYKLRISDEKRLYAEEKARNLQKEFDRLQHKVRMDFNQIKAREKELEGQLELAKMDSESQVSTRDKKILDLKRKIDQLEFNMENAVIKEEKSREDKQKLEDRLERIMKTLRGSIEVLEDDMDWQQTTKKDNKP